MEGGVDGERKKGRGTDILYNNDLPYFSPKIILV